MNLHDVWAEFTAELAHLFARFHSHPVVIAAVAAQAAQPAPAAPVPTPAPVGADPIDHSAQGIVLGTAVEALTGKPAANGPAGGAPGPIAPTPPANPDVLDTDGQPYPFPVPGKLFTMPVQGGLTYRLETAECYKPVTVTVSHADGRLVLDPVTDNGGHAYVRFQAQDTETLNVNVSALEQGGDIERHVSG